MSSNLMKVGVLAIMTAALAGNAVFADCITCSSPTCGATVKVCQNGDGSTTVTVYCPGKAPVSENFSTGVSITLRIHCGDGCYVEVSPDFPWTWGAVSTCGQLDFVL